MKYSLRSWNDVVRTCVDSCFIALLHVGNDKNKKTEEYTIIVDDKHKPLEQALLTVL
jgi:hypothetical protein